MSKNHRHRKRHAISRRTRPGASPGTVLPDPQSPAPRIQAMGYGPGDFQEQPAVSLHDIPKLREKHRVLWINVDGLGDAATIEAIGKIFGFHRLALEDVVNVHQRPKVEDYGDHLFIVSRMAHEGGERLATEQLSMFLGTNYVVTFQDLPGDSLEPVRERLRKSVGKLRERGADYLAYALLDATIDGYYPVIERISEVLESVEEQLLARPDESSLAPLRDLKHDLLTLRRAIWPHREAFGLLIRERHAQVADDTRVYLRDCYDHVVQLIDLVEIYRELAMDLRDFYMSAMSHRINETMRILTIVSTIFIPITFIAGVYGMNFDTKQPWNMPELLWPYGYLFSLGLMAATVVFMLAYFRRQGWIRLRWLWQKEE